MRYVRDNPSRRAGLQVGTGKPKVDKRERFRGVKEGGGEYHMVVKWIWEEG